MSFLKCCTKVTIYALFIFLATAVNTFAQEYVLETNDRISVHFWQETSLDIETTIDSEGKIVVPVAGRITAAGLTISQLENKIVQKINIYNRNVTQALVKIIEYGSKKIFFFVSVLMPGPLTFSKMPNVWEAILQAGGPLETARLDNITILRGGDNHGQRIPVNLTNYFDDLTKLPELRPNDNVYVPSAATNGEGGAGGTGPGGVSLYAKKKVIYIFGEVSRPGRYELEEHMDVLQAIVIAGGPSSGGGSRSGASAPAIQPDLTSVRIISAGQDGSVVYRLNLERYAREGIPVPFQLKPGDTVYIPAKDAYGRFLMTNIVRTVLTSAVSIAVSLIIFHNTR